MIANFILVLINIVYLILNINKHKRINKKLDGGFFLYLNIILFVINLLTFIIDIIYKEYNFLFMISMIIHLLVSLLLLKIKKDNKITSYQLLLILSIISVVLVRRVGGNYSFSSFFNLILYLIINIVYFIYIIKLLIKNKGEVCFYPKESDKLVDINYVYIIQLNKVTNYFIFWALFIVFLKIRFLYVEILYIVTLLLMLKYFIDNYKLIKKTLIEIDNQVIFKNEYPSKILSFHILHRILKLKALIHVIAFYLITIFFFYIDDSIYVSVPLYLFLIYIILENKITLIKHIYSINPKLIRTDNYNTISNIKINKYVEYNILGFNLYKFNYKKYTSTILIFNPDLIIEKANIRVNKNNKNDYIIDVSKYFM